MSAVVIVVVVFVVAVVDSCWCCVVGCMDSFGDCCFDYELWCGQLKVPLMPRTTLLFTVHRYIAFVAQL